MKREMLALKCTVFELEACERQTGRQRTGGSIGEFKGGEGGHASPELGPNKFQERPSGASRMKENLLAAGADPFSSWLPHPQ